MANLLRYTMYGQYWSRHDAGDWKKILANSRLFVAEIQLEGSKFTGKMIDPFGEAQITEGEFVSDQEIKFVKTYDAEAQKRGGSRIPVAYQLNETEMGGWFGDWTIPPHDDARESMVNGNVVMTIE